MPGSASRREQVQKAVRFGEPDYLPLVYFNGERNDSDIIVVDVERHFDGVSRDRSEWGFCWRRSDETMGQPVAPVFSSQKDITSYFPPDAHDLTRFATIGEARDRFGEDRYYLASLGLSGFTIMTFLWGFARILEDLYLDRAVVDAVADIVFRTENDIIAQLPGYGIDGVAFFDDWGTQSGMIISPELFREYFKPRYTRQFEFCRTLGLDVYFHSCGHYLPIIDDLIDAGVNMLNLSQPNVYNIPEMGCRYGGKVCFVCPVSYQTTSISGSCDEIRSAVAELIDAFASTNGGLIGYVEEYDSIGLSRENYDCCVDAFRTLGSRVR